MFKIAVSISLTLTAVLGAVIWEGATFRWVGNQQDYEPAQPVNFSHRVHAGLNKIPCLYCHFAAERSKVAGIPPLSVCMNCHSQILKDAPEVQKIARALSENREIAWVRVHSLPSFVAFNHRRHVEGGLSCGECHGEVEAMDRIRQVPTLYMGWCIDCHRQRQGTAVGEGATQRVLRPSTDCVACHY